MLVNASTSFCSLGLSYYGEFPVGGYLIDVYGFAFSVPGLQIPVHPSTFSSAALPYSPEHNTFSQPAPLVAPAA
jgi:hypothetical protein